MLMQESQDAIADFLKFLSATPPLVTLAELEDLSNNLTKDPTVFDNADRTVNLIRRWRNQHSHLRETIRNWHKQELEGMPSEAEIAGLSREFLIQHVPLPDAGELAADVPEFEKKALEKGTLAVIVAPAKNPRSQPVRLFDFVQQKIATIRHELTQK